MSKVLLVGYNPPYLEGHSKIEAAHYRTWQFLEPLLSDGHAVCLCADSSNTDDAQLPLPEEWAGRLVYHAIPFRRESGWGQHLQCIHDAFDPDCIVAVNFDSCLRTTKLRTDKPIWMDIYGDYLTIVQVICHRMGADRGVPTSIAFVQRVLQKGDAFSGCSTPQSHALVGQLSMAGRLSGSTFGYEFAHVILPGASPMNTQAVEQKERSFLSSQGVPGDSFVVLWCGGYNAWTDIETLFAGLEWAMAQESKVHYVSVGANTYQKTDNVYTRLLGMIQQSPHRNRFHMLGWRPWGEIPNYYRGSDVGLNIDAPHYETIYGTRTRLVEMIAAGLPVVTSLGCELSYLIGRHGAGLTFEPGDRQGLGEQILALARDRDLYATTAKRALDYASNDLSFGTTTIPVRNWVREPCLAPDKKPASFWTRMHRLEYQARSIVRQAIWRVAGLDM
jgi:glycosyltransferase involved in cell wall biosynthesis